MLFIATQVKRLPTFIIIDSETGKVVAKYAHPSVREDPTGLHFPWIDPILQDLLSGPAINAKGESSTVAELSAGKVTCVYFDWGGPHKVFTLLVELYNAAKGTEKEFEVLFVSRYGVALVLSSVLLVYDIE